MKLPRLLDRAADFVLDIFALAITAQVGNVLIGRILNSRTAFALDTTPVVGNLTQAGRAFWDQGYDPAGEEG